MKRIVLSWAALSAALLFSLACGMPTLSSLFPAPTATVRPTRTPRPTFTATPTQTPFPTSTATPTKTNTPVPTNTPTQAPPTDTPVPPTPTNTRRPVPPTATFTPQPPAPPPPTATPANDFTGRIGDITNPAAFSCSQTMVVVRVVDRAGKGLAGYHIHYGQDGGWDKWDTIPTTESTKEPFGYNSAYSFSTEGPLTVYVSIFHDEIHPFDVNQSLSAPGEVTAHIDAKDLQGCADSNNRTDGTAVRIAPVVFTYNR